MEIRVPAPAKVNLSLWITEKLPNGYHRILTLFYKIPIYDEIWVEEWDDIRVKCEGIKSESTNTVYKALKYLSEYVGREICLKIRIKKRIPVGGGLGGGSSDAAAVLKVANEIFKLGLSLRELSKIAVKVGADVPFFLLPHRAAIGRGIGEELEPIDLTVRGKWVLVFPAFPVPTKLAYSLIEIKGIYTNEKNAEEKLRELIKNLKEGKKVKLENDFENVIFERFPEIGEIKSTLVRNGWNSVMSGSGSSVFGLNGEGFENLKGSYKIWFWEE